MEVGGLQITTCWLPEATFSTFGNDVDFFIDFWCQKWPKVSLGGSIWAPFWLKKASKNRREKRRKKGAKEEFHGRRTAGGRAEAERMPSGAQAG